MKKQILSLAAGAALLLAASSSFALMSPSQPFAVSAVIVGGCTLTVNPLGAPIGTYPNSPVGTVLGIAAGDINVACPTGTNYAVMFDGGNQPLAATRQLLGPIATDLISYAFKSAGVEVGDNNSLDSSYAPANPAAWAAGITGSGGVVGGDTYPLTVDLDLTVAKNVGTYTDTVNVTLTL